MSPEANAVNGADDPLARLAVLPGVAEAVDAARDHVDRLYRHRVMRRRSAEVATEGALRGARASAALSGADWALEEVRRRGDFGGDEAARTVGAALRLTAEAGELAEIWRGSPLRVLARLHLVAAGVGGAVARAALGRPRLAGEPVAPDGQLPDGLSEPPDAREVAARLDALTRLVVSGSRAPAVVTAAVVHGELLALRPFVSHNALVARAAERIALVSGGLDPKAAAPAEVGHAELGRDAYGAALAGYAAGTGEGLSAWLTHCARAVALGTRESAAVCEALRRGAA